MDATRAIILGGAAGLAGLVMLALPDYLPPAVASDEPIRTLLSSPSELWPPAFNPDTLMKWDYYVQPGVSIEPIRESTVRKIGYGKTTMVHVMETESGVYSTDALASPHVEYPGIIKQLRPTESELIWQLVDGRWVLATARAADSFSAVTPLGSGQQVRSDEGGCTRVGRAIYC